MPTDGLKLRKVRTATSYTMSMQLRKDLLEMVTKTLRDCFEQHTNRKSSKSLEIVYLTGTNLRFVLLCFHPHLSVGPQMFWFLIMYLQGFHFHLFMLRDQVYLF